MFLALGVLAHRMDLFLTSQDVLFPAAVFVAGAVSLARNWRRRTALAATVDAMEMLDAAALSERIGDLRPAAASLAPNPTGAAISFYARSHERTSRPG